MDSAGSGGREILFQAEQEQLTRLYQRVVPRPHGTVIARDVFETGILLADSDYRIFRDHAQVRGIDLAVYMNGYVYHTRLDTEKTINPGSIQHQGDNALAIIQAAIESDFLDKLVDSDFQSEDLVYFDILGYYMFMCSQSVAKWVYRAFAILFFVYLYTKSIKRNDSWFVVVGIGSLVSAFFSALISLVTGIAFAIIAAVINTHVLRNPMSWYSSQGFALTLFTIPTLLGMFVAQTFVPMFDFKRMIRKQAEMLLFLGALIVQLFVMIVMSEGGLGSAYIMFVPLVFGLLAIMANDFLISGSSRNGESAIHWGAYIIALFPMIMHVDVFFALLDVFIPTTGRVGAFTPADIMVGGIVGAFLSLSFLILLALFHRAGNMKSVLKILAVAFVVIMAASMMRFGYSVNHPKRLFATHVTRRTLSNLPAPHQAKPSFMENPDIVYPDQKEMDSFLLLSSSDPTSTELPLRPWMEKRTDLTFHEHYNPPDWDVLYPFNFFLKGYQVKVPPMSEEEFPTPKIEVIRNDYNKKIDQRVLHFKIDYTGFEWTTFRFNASLISWSKTQVLPPRPAGHYMLRHVSCHGSRHWDIELQVEGNEPIRFDVTAVHFVKTKPMQEMHDMLPDWIQALDTLATVAVSFEV
eukprot:TRINITY_DN12627_c0_g2_i1.p1 TRINITY_DN12627_c0_g2~~TRINITY_DN12627_c0_g2_i1.p1  ORF type:complete len:694 (+),score=240.06 TRINITY_DN12627_c0_g2_i1:179-2083(+)